MWPFGFGLKLEKWMLWHPINTVRDILRYLPIRWARGGKGWHWTDTWSLDRYLARWLPGALRDLADAPGCPGSYDTVAEWQAELEKAAVALEAYSEAMVASAEEYEAAEEAMHWIADHFGALWW